MKIMRTKNELQKLLNEHYNDSYPGDDDVFDASFLGEVRLVNSTSEYDDGNEACSVTYYFKDFDQYVTFSGYYSSYSGHELESWDFVRPVEKTVIVYEPVEAFKKLSFVEIKKIIDSDLFDKYECGPEQWMCNDVYDSLVNVEPSELKFEWEKLGDYKLVQPHGGEGQGDDYYAVYHFIDHDVYIKFKGYYSSYEGFEYQNMCEVFPQEVTITKFISK